MGHNHAARLARAQDQLGQADLNGLLIGPSADLLYLAGYDAPLLERLTALILRRDGDPVLLVPELEEPRAAASPAGGLLHLAVWPDGGDPFEFVRGLLPSGGRLGVSERMWALHLLGLQSALAGAKFVLATPVLSALRVRKDPGEIELLARAAQAADDAFGLIAGEGLTGRRENEVSRRLFQLLLDQGCDSAAFAIVGSGPNGASPHHEASARIISTGDVAVVLDFGGRVGGYCSDVTRTVSVGEAPAEVREVHAIVREAQEAAFRAVRPGVPAQEVDRTARRVIERAGYADRFTHRTGHGIGLDEHEDPYIVEGNDDPLEPGMCFSIEPGIYLPGRFGVRIEDIVAVTEDGARRLNHATRELVIVG